MNFNTRKTHLYLTLSAALCVGSTFSAHAASVNINNPGFESNWSGWNDTDPSAITSDERSGSKGAKITGSSGKFEQEVNVENNTNYTLSAYVKGSGKIGASVNGERYTRTGGGSSYEEVTVSFNSGSADTVTIFANYDGGEGRFDDFTLVSEGTTDDNSGGSTGATASVPGTIQAEDYDNYSDTTSSNRGGQYRTDGVDIQTTSDSGGGYNVGWIAAGEWLEYDIDVNSTASYTLDARVASSKSTGSFIIQVDGSQVGDEINVGNTGGWQSWTTKSIDLGQLSVGTRTLRVFVTGKDFNLNWLDISETGGGNNNGGGGNTGGGNTDGNDCEASGRILYNGSCDEYSAVYEAEHGDIGEEDHLVSLSPIEMTFDALAAKHVTPNGNGWRHELKIKSSGGFRVGMTELYEEFKAKITARLDDGAKTIVAQHHADTTATITKLYIADLDEGGFANAPDGTSSDSVAMNGIFDVYIRLAKEDGSGETKHLLTTIRSGESFDFEEINDHGTVTIKINGQSLSPITVNDSSASYFKFGNYQQAQNPETGDKLESGDRDGDYDDFYAEYFNTSEITFTEMSYTRTVD